MRLATFSTDGTDPRVGAVRDGEIADLTACDGGPPMLTSLLQQPDWASALAPMLTRAPLVPLDAATLHSPVPTPGMYMAIGLNARDHRRDINARWLLREPKLIRIAAGYLLAHPRPKHPFFFAKGPRRSSGRSIRSCCRFTPIRSIGKVNSR